MSKTSVFTTITPLPSNITRESVIETYHNHIEMIELNPLVIERFKCKPPAYATPEEFHATWYTIIDKVSYLPGGLATGSVSYHACFHDLPDALQTHVYAPLGLDIKAKWSVGGSLPGEPKQPVELGLGIPKEGLWLREDVKMKCNVMLISFVKKTFKDAHSTLVNRLVEKAHILEAEQANKKIRASSPLLQATSPTMLPGSPMFTPGSQGYQHMSMCSNASSGHSGSPLGSPGLQYAQTFGPHPASSPHTVDPAYQAASPYANDPRYSQQYGDQKIDPRISYYPDPKADPRFLHYPDPRLDPSIPQDPRYSSYHQTYSHVPQNAPVELSSHEVPAKGPGGNEQTGPVELA